MLSEIYKVLIAILVAVSLLFIVLYSYANMKNKELATKVETQSNQLEIVPDIINRATFEKKWETMKDMQHKEEVKHEDINLSPGYHRIIFKD